MGRKLHYTIHCKDYYPCYINTSQREMPGKSHKDDTTAKARAERGQQ